MIIGIERHFDLVRAFGQRFDINPRAVRPPGFLIVDEDMRVTFPLHIRLAGIFRGKTEIRGLNMQRVSGRLILNELKIDGRNFPRIGDFDACFGADLFR